MGFGFFLVKVNNETVEEFDGVIPVDRARELDSVVHKTKVLNSMTYSLVDDIVDVLKESKITEFEDLDFFIDSNGTCLNFNECKMLKQGFEKLLNGESAIVISSQISFYLGMIYQSLNLVRKDYHFLLIQ